MAGHGRDLARHCHAQAFGCAGERIGPELLQLVGGSTAFWIKTTGAGEILITVESARFEPQELKLTVLRG